MRFSQVGSLTRSRWAAVGATVAVTFGAGGLFTAFADSPPSTFTAITPVRVLDTRTNIGLTGAFTDGTARNLDVTGMIPIVLPGNIPGTGTAVPDGATAVVANVTAVTPSSQGYVSVRPGTATGIPTTSNLNLTPGITTPNSVTVELPTTGGLAGQLNLFFRGTSATATTDLLVDIVGYYMPGTGAKGDKGDKGDPGVTGPRGVSSWDVIPSGQTISGDIVVNFPIEHPGFNTYTPLGATAPVALTDSDVNFAEAGLKDTDATCTGNSTTPTAPPGKVCIYVYSIAHINGLATEGYAARLPKQGFRIYSVGNDGGDPYIYGSWAYTAP